MNVLFAVVEMSPLAKVGGLADVAGSLPRALRARGVDVRVALPMHGVIERAGLQLRHLLHGVLVPAGAGSERVDVWTASVGDVPVYLIENERYFGREEVYGYDDDAERMLFYCDAVAACAPHLGFQPDVVHAHDWHAGLLLTRLAADARHTWARCGRVFTIHNLALHGAFDGAFAAAHDIGPEQLAVPAGLPAGTALSGMAQGIMNADRVNTVSETYAREILTPEYGAGFDALLRARADALSGIVNGIDYDEFNPQTDPALAQRYGAETLDTRIANKRALQQQAGLPTSDDALLFGVVTRLFAQKGIDLAAQAFDALLARPDGQGADVRTETAGEPQMTQMDTDEERGRQAQLVVLGTGDPDVHTKLSALEAKYPQRVKVWFDFNPPLGQQIYAGCDVFLMPSRYEPCGLGQLIALRYGAVPLVRRTGGLRDTVQDYDAAAASGTGFVFDEADAASLRGAIERALAAYADRPAWRALQERGMAQDWSWRRAAGSYVELYDAALAARREPASAGQQGA